MKTIVSIGALLVTLTWNLSASAHEIQYLATLSGPAEVAPNTSPGYGSAKITIDYDLLTMDVQASFSSLLGTVTASHIHCCTAVAGTGPAGVATMTPSFLDFPLGVTAGTYDHVFDLSQASTYNSAFITANGGTVSGALNALALGLDAGTAYFNIHTSSFPGGEIRGFLAPVPVPAALWLFGSAVLGLVPWARRKSVA